MGADGSPQLVARTRPGSFTRFAILFSAVLLGALGMGAGTSFADSTPIQGTWNFQHGQVVVQANPDGSLIGTDVVATTFVTCPHPVGDVIWNISGSGLSYTGTHEWLKNDCSKFAPGLSTWTINNTDPAQYVMTFCTAYPGSGPPDPAATPGNPVGSTLCYSLHRAKSPAQTQAVPLPANTALPTISGTPKPGNTLTCSTGSWTNSPGGYNYQWNRDGTPIAGAAGVTNSTYTVAPADVGHTLTCTVRAANLGGLGMPATSNGVVVPLPGCPVATGRLHGRTLGLVKLGMTRAHVRHAYGHSSDRRGKFQDFFCLTPTGVHVGYASPKLLAAFPRQTRKQLRLRVVWVSTANPFYAVRGVRPGGTVAAARLHLKLGARFHAGANFWYLAPNGGSTAVVEVRHGIVEAVGIADKRLTRGRHAGRKLIRTFK